MQIFIQVSITFMHNTDKIFFQEQVYFKSTTLRNLKSTAPRPRIQHSIQQSFPEIRKNLQKIGLPIDFRLHRSHWTKVRHVLFGWQHFGPYSWKTLFGFHLLLIYRYYLSSTIFNGIFYIILEATKTSAKSLCFP